MCSILYLFSVLCHLNISIFNLLEVSQLKCHLSWFSNVLASDHFKTDNSETTVFIKNGTLFIDRYFLRGGGGVCEVTCKGICFWTIKVCMFCIRARSKNIFE